MPTKLGIFVICQIFDTYMEDVHTYIAAYEATLINHVIFGSVHIFDIHHSTNMVAKLHMYV